MNINTNLLQMVNVTGKGDIPAEKTSQTDSLISFRNILAEKLNEKGSNSFKGEVSEKTLTDKEHDTKDLLSDPFFYFAAQLGFLDNLKNFLKNDGNTIAVKSGETAISEVSSSGNSIPFNQDLTDMLAALKNDNSMNKELTDMLTGLQNNNSANKELADILTGLQNNGSMNKELTDILTGLQNNGSIDKELAGILTGLQTDGSTNKELTDILTALQTDGSTNKKLTDILTALQTDGSTNKELTDILTALQTGNSINKELAGIMSNLRKDGSISSAKQDIPVKKIENSADVVSVFSETILKDNIMTEKGFKELLEKVSQSLKDLINSAGTSEKLPDTVSSIKELLSQLLASGDTLKDIIKKSDYKDLEGLISKSPFLAKVQDLLNLFDRKTDSSDKKKNVSDILSEASSIVSSLEQSTKKHSGKETEYKGTDIAGKEEKDIFLLQQKTLENITYNRVHTGNTKNSSEVKTDITSIELSSQIVKKIDWKNTEKNSIATITLEPERLGKMRVEVNLAATGEVSARFITQNKQTGDLLSEQLNQLKQSLADQGLKLGNFSVATEDRSSSGFQHYMPDFNEKKYVDPIKNDKEDYSPQLNNKITTSQMDYFV